MNFPWKGMFTPPALAKPTSGPPIVKREADDSSSEDPYKAGDYLLCHNYQMLSACCQVVLEHVGGTRYWVHCEGTSESESIMIDVEADYDRVTKVSADVGTRPRNLYEDIPDPYPIGDGPSRRAMGDGRWATRWAIASKIGICHVPRPPRGPPLKTEAGKGSPKKPALEKTTGKGDLMDAVCRGERYLTGKGGLMDPVCQKAWAQAKAVEARGERYLKVSESEAEAALQQYRCDFCEQVEAERLEAVGHFYVPCEDAKLRGLIDGRIITAPPVSAAKAEIDTSPQYTSPHQANAGRAFDWAVKRLKQADPRIIVVIKRKNEDETDGEYLIRRRRETHVAALGLWQPKSGSRESAEEKDGEEKASSSEGAGGIVGEGPRSRYPAVAQKTKGRSRSRSKSRGRAQV
jgi:hypothetical protein